MSYNPYKKLPNKSYWKRSVSEKSFFEITELWTPKLKISRNDIFATYGSCFAQHFSNALRAQGIRWSNCEPAPGFVSNELSVEYNYGVYSSRTQNIYTPTMLLQWLKMSISNDFSSYEVWEENGRFYDPIRPAVEPNGFASKSELLKAREVTASCFLRSIKNCTVFKFRNRDWITICSKYQCD